MSVNAHLAVMRNPFSTAVPTAKVPDGRVATSIGCRHNVSASVSSTVGSFVVMLSPSFSCPCTVSHWRNTAAEGNKLEATFFKGSDEFQYKVGAGDAAVTSNISNSVDFNQLELGVGDADDEYQFVGMSNTPEKARIVSCGVRVTPINNSDLNSGWFEAIRVPSSYDTNEILYMYQESGPSGATFGSFSPNVAKFENGLRDANWSNYPGYISGKVRDLPRHMFYLQNQGTNDFTVLKEDYNIIGRSIKKTDAVADDSAILFLSGNADGFMDRSWDTILIRIHAVPGASVQQVPTMHVHAVLNTENIYNPRSQLKKYESRTASAAVMVQKLNAVINRDPKPSVIRMYNA